MTNLVSQRERCEPCGMKLRLTAAEAHYLAERPGSPLVAYPCPSEPGWHHVAREYSAGPPDPDFD